MKIAQEEIFGPVLVVIRYKNIDDAIRMANDSIYGLGGAVWSKDKDKAMAVAKQMRTGTVWINDYHLLSVAAPFGGYKQSGIGREFGLEGILEYTEMKHIHVDQVDNRAGEVLVRGAVRRVSVTIDATPKAEEVLARVRAAHAGEDLVFVFGSGCCEGTAPHLFAGYTLTPAQARVGTVARVGVFADAHVRRLYAERRIVARRRGGSAGRRLLGGDPLGWRFVLRTQPPR